jgi:membrane protein implicated in regulation of membrane protease activity
MWLFWLILCGIFLIIEIFTTSFLMFWPGIGAFLAFLVSLITDSQAIQISVFSISSILLIIFMKPLVKKFFKSNDTTVMNTDSLIGKTGIVVKTINSAEGKGQVKINGELWSAFTLDENAIINEGERVVIESISGVRLQVKPL